jgi:hypothetical protein
VYGISVKHEETDEMTEKLLRLRAKRRGTIVDLLVHYAVRREKGCDTYIILNVSEN